MWYFLEVEFESEIVVAREEINTFLAGVDISSVETNLTKAKISRITSINSTTTNGVSYLLKRQNLNVPLDQLKGLLVLDSEFLSEVSKLSSEAEYICVDDPKYLFAYLCQKVQKINTYNKLLPYSKITHSFIHSTAQIAPSARIHPNVTIGKNSVIEEGVSIHDATIIGANVHIKDNAVIGGSGFGYAVRQGHPPLTIPHLGGVILNDNVDIGSCSTIDRGTFGDTVIGSDVKIDNGVHIAHNVIIGGRTLIIAHAEISGSVRIGSDCWIAPKVAIREKVIIGSNVTIGLGSVVLNDIEDNLIVVGTPARPIKKRS